MSNSLVICEKPSQARALSAALGSRYGQILPAVGHILTLEEPDDVREDWKKWSAELLWPGRFYEKKPVASTKAYLDKIRAAARGASQIIIATDCDREGQLIGDEIVEFIGFKGTVKRAIFNAEDPKTLQEAFAKLRPNSDFRGLYMSGQAREQADQTSNLSLTRTATVTFKAPGSKGAIGIGRVKTPVLAIVCKRELEILNFKPQDMFEVDALTRVEAGHITLSCGKMPQSLIKEEAAAEEEEVDEVGADEAALEEAETTRGKIMDRRVAEGLAAAATGCKGRLRSKSERKKQAPPKLFDLTALQSACSTRFGWTGEKTLKVAQALYSDRTIITYPRGEAKYLPENNIADIPRLVPALMGLPGYRAHRDLLAKPEVRKGKSGHFSNKALEGLSHYAIIPNANTADTFARVVPALSDDEGKLFDLVVRQYLAALAPDYEYRQTTVNMTVPWKGHDWDFRASGRVPLVPGWKAILGGVTAKGEDEDPEMCPVKDGETGTIEKASLRTVTTKPPARYTEGALIRVMQEAWRLVEDPAMRARLKEAKGIGTPATRGDVVKGLITQGQITAKGKSLMPTPGGMELYKILASTCPNVVDPARTALWETLFDRVEKGQMTAEQAIGKVLEETTKMIATITSRSGTSSIAIGGKQKPTERMIAAAKNISEKKRIKLPVGCTSDATVCRKFLEEHLPKREPGAEGSAGGGGANPPSDAQLALAERLSKETGIEVPAAATASGREMSAWIDATMKKAPPRLPSDKQIGLARRLSEEKGEPLPAGWETNMKICSAFIDKMFGNSGGAKSGGAKTGQAARKPGGRVDNRGFGQKGPSPMRAAR